MFHDYFHLHKYQSDQNRMVRELELKRSVEASGRQLTYRKFSDAREKFSRLFGRARERKAANQGLDTAQDRQTSVGSRTMASE